MSEVENIAAHLPMLAADLSSRPAVISPDGSLTYLELEQRTNQCARGLRHFGVKQGTPVVMMVRPGVEFMVLSFALIKIGALLIFLDPGMGRQNLTRCLAEVKPEVFIGAPRAHLARIFLGWARETLRLRITVGGTRWWGGASFEDVMRHGGVGQRVHPAPLDPDVPAAVVFTSGSTGVPKGVTYSHRMLAAQAALMRNQYGIEPGEVDLATFPLFAFHDPALRMATVFPEMDFSRPMTAEPGNLIQSIQTHKVTHMFASPALLQRIGRYAEDQGVRLLTLRRVLTAGAPVPPPVLRRFVRLLGPEGKIYTPYGATEALPVSSISARELLEETENVQELGICVGPPIPGVGLAIIKIADEPISTWSDDLLVRPGEIGELVVWGSNVSKAYWRRSRDNGLSKIAGPDGEVRHRMGDLGRLDGKGRVWFCGRKSQRVITSSGPLFTIPCEVIFNQHPKVLRTALVGVGPAPRQRPVLCVELKDKRHWKGSSQLEREILALGERYPHTRHIRTILFHRDFPVDVRHNAKIFREELARWAEKKVS